MKRFASLPLLCGCAALPAAAQPTTDAAFVQLGTAPNQTRMLAAGISTDWSWQLGTAFGTVVGYWEATAGIWSVRRSDDGTASAPLAQVGVTPVLRLRSSDPAGGWFVEGGIGVNLLLPRFRSGDKRFSTAFNFGDHVAVGWRFDRWELALRYQHFSNAGIREPNPGENLLQLRCALRF